MILPRERMHAREVICPLKWLHTHYPFGGEAQITPQQIVIITVLLAQAHFEIPFHDLPKNCVLSVGHVGYKSRLPLSHYRFLFYRFLLGTH